MHYAMGGVGVLHCRNLVMNREIGATGAVAKRRTVIFMLVAIGTFSQLVLRFTFLHDRYIHIAAGQTAQRQCQYGHEE